MADGEAECGGKKARRVLGLWPKNGGMTSESWNRRTVGLRAV